MQPGDTHGTCPNPHLPKIPDDVTHLVAQFSSFEVLASLVQCNKSLHRSCTALLFREIRLHKPTQLVKLCQNREALSRLSETKSMFLGEELFYIYLWADAGADALRYFTTALRATTSLLRLHLFDAPSRNIVSDHLIATLRSIASDLTFLPKLEILVGIRSISLRPLHENRPVKFLCSYEDFDEIVVETYPSLSGSRSPFSTAPSALLEHARGLSATEIGTLIRESKGSLLVKYPYLNLTVRFPEAIRAKGNLYIPNLLAWLQEVVQEADLSSDGVKWLQIKFDPSPWRLFHSEQHTIVTKLSELLPQLDRAQIAYDTWYKYSGSLESSQDSLPLWTPEPRYFSFKWWLDKLHIDLTGTKAQEELEHIAIQLRDGMRKRYPPGEDSTCGYYCQVGSGFQ